MEEANDFWRFLCRPATRRLAPIVAETSAATSMVWTFQRFSSNPPSRLPMIPPSVTAICRYAWPFVESDVRIMLFTKYTEAGRSSAKAPIWNIWASRNCVTLAASNVARVLMMKNIEPMASNRRELIFRKKNGKRAMTGTSRIAAIAAAWPMVLLLPPMFSTM